MVCWEHFDCWALSSKVTKEIESLKYVSVIVRKCHHFSCVFHYMLVYPHWLLQITHNSRSNELCVFKVWTLKVEADVSSVVSCVWTMLCGSACSVSLPVSSSRLAVFLLLVALRVDAELSYTSVSDMYGTLQSPNFPEPYPRETDLCWNISVPSGFQIRLYFSHFDLEPSYLCEYDFVKVRQQGIVGSFR